MNERCPHCLFDHYTIYVKAYSGTDRKYLGEYAFLKPPYFCPNCGKLIEVTCDSCGQVVISKCPPSNK